MGMCGVFIFAASSSSPPAPGPERSAFGLHAERRWTCATATGSSGGLCSHGSPWPAARRNADLRDPRLGFGRRARRRISFCSVPLRERSGVCGIPFCNDSNSEHGPCAAELPSTGASPSSVFRTVLGAEHGSPSSSARRVPSGFLQPKRTLQLRGHVLSSARGTPWHGLAWRSQA